MTKHINMDPSLRSDKSLLELAAERGYGDFHVKIDPESGLQAVIAIHSNARGPAIGGCRFVHYERFGDAVVDALNLGRGMSLKAAIHNLPHGGGKAVVLKPDRIKDRPALFKALGKFVHEQGGRYITAVDSGTCTADMDEAIKVTPYVLATGANDEAGGNPSYATATGVRRAIEAGVKFKLGKDTLDGVHVAVQGLGSVGQILCKQLNERGAKLTVCDVHKDHVDAVIAECHATAVDIDSIHTIDCDVFSPCALGGTINPNTIPELKCQVVCGAANNQFTSDEDALDLHQRGIVQVPDYVANGGGLIYVSVIYAKQPASESQRLVDAIYDTTLDILQQSQAKDTPPINVAHDIAMDRISHPDGSILKG